MNIHESRYKLERRERGVGWDGEGQCSLNDSSEGMGVGVTGGLEGRRDS